MTHIVIPAAGLGSRFKSPKYADQPKPLISWNNKPMLTHVVNNFLDNYSTKITIIKQKSTNFEYDHKNVNIIDIDYLTSGPASTVYLADIQRDEPLLVVNCDQIIKDWHPQDFYSFAKDYDGVVGCFFSNKSCNSYARINDNFLITQIKEKEKISNIATNGLHYWSKGGLFIDSYQQMLKNNDTVNNEFFIAPSYNYLIEQNYKIGVFMFNRHFPIGTPEDLDHYLNYENISCF